MSDILLKDLGIWKAIDPISESGEHPEWADYMLPFYQALCRAQVAHLWKWLVEDCAEHEPAPDAETIPVQRLDCHQCMKALRATGGE